MTKKMFKIKNDNNLDSARDSICTKINSVFPQGCNKILLIQPGQISEGMIDVLIARNKRYYMYPPYALGVLSTNAKKKGYDVKVVDLNYEIFEFIHNNPPEEVTPEVIESLWKEKLKTSIEEYSPDMVGISCTFTMGHDLLTRSADFIKSLRPGLPVIAGGVHVTNAPVKVLKDGPNIDFVCLYESDTTFGVFLDYINQKVKKEKLSQIGTLLGKKYVSLPVAQRPAGDELNVIPDYGSLPLEKYSNLGEIGTFRYWRDPSRKGSSVLSNRGCRARCTFCSVANFNGKGVRGRTVESVVDEIQDLKERYGISHVTWLDDDLFFRPSRAISLFNEIVKRDLNITWDASNGIIASAAVSHEELVAASAESGCIGMYFGLESGNDQILRKVKKPSTVKHFLRLGEMMKKYPQIFTRGFLMMGFPGETLRQINDTIEIALEMELDWYTVQLLTPLPSTPIYNEMVEEGYIEEGSLNTDGEGYTMFSVRESERQRRKEKKQQSRAREFSNMFKTRLDAVPSKDELNELWFLVDYLINYQRLIQMSDIKKLKKLKRFLTDVSDRMTMGNPVSNLFLGIIEEKLGNHDEGIRRKILASDYVSDSKYWQTRFDVLDLTELLVT
jgi:radical SAM superfamily enzyme YgiQ (UPF0313 family)